MSMPLLFHPAEESFVVAGTREEWMKKCEESLRKSPDFRSVASSPTLFRLTAQYRKPPVWGELTVTLTPEGPDSTRISARATTQPNLFTLIFSPEHRMLDDFAEAIR
jgi:hypothetical protein